MVLNIYTEDLYSDLEKIKDHLDTSNYPKDHPLYSIVSKKKIIGKFKDELGGKIMTKFIGLRSKMYGYEYLEDSKIKFKCLAKGVNKTTKNEFNSWSYESCLSQKKVTHKPMFNIVHKKHKIYLNEMIKIGLSPFDDKRFICEDGINTLPYGTNGLVYLFNLFFIFLFKYFINGIIFLALNVLCSLDLCIPDEKDEYNNEEDFFIINIS